MFATYTRADKAMLLLWLITAGLAVANLTQRGEWAAEVIVYGDDDERMYHVRDFKDWDEMLESIEEDDAENLADIEEKIE